MKRSARVGVVVGGVLFSASGVADAFERGDEGGSKYGVVSPFSDDPMGGGDTAAVLSPAPAKDAPAAASPKDQPLMTRPGLVFQFGSGIRYLGGAVAQGVDIGGVFFDLDAKIGVYLNQHVGLFAGAEMGVGSLTKGCAADCTDAARFAFPVTVQIAFIDRVRGPYIDGGLVVAPTYLGATPSDSSSSPETLKVSGLADGRFGVGYRVPVNSVFGPRLRSALDIHAGLDVGRFASLDYGNVAGDVTGDIPSSQSAIHYTFALNLDWHFAL